MISAMEPPRQSALPSISHLGDASKLKREDDDQSRRPPHLSNSPTMYRFGGASQYNPHHPAGPSGMISPPESRRTSSEEQIASAPARQSLPSIHEALGRESSLSYPPPPPPPSAAATSTSSFFPHSSSTITAEPHPRAPSSYAPPPPQAARSEPPPPPPNTARANSLPGPQMYPAHGAKAPLQPIRTGNSPPLAHGHAPYQVEQPTTPYNGPQSAPANGSFAYSGYQSQHPYPPGVSAGQPHPGQPAVMSAPAQYPPQSAGWAQDQAGKRGLRPLKAYGDSVKRRLDQFDMEASLYELSGCGGRLKDYTENCCRRYHDAQNTGDAAAKIVSKDDLDNLSKDIQLIQRAFSKLKEVVEASHAELQVEQKDLHRPYPPGSAPDMNPYGSESSLPPGGQPDPKKRRGRAAPPGRCHSCNRAETPEWRRGPDGARTLCNACGLHYAKLTRKMGNHNKSISNSSLRPKGPGSM